MVAVNMWIFTAESYVVIHTDEPLQPLTVCWEGMPGECEALET